MQVGLRCLLVAMLAVTGAAQGKGKKPAGKGKPAAGKAAAPSKAASFETVGQEQFAETAMSTTGGVKLAVGPDKTVYAVVHSKAITASNNILDAYKLEGNQWVRLGQAKFAQDVGGLDLAVTPEGTLLVACTKAVYRFDAGEGKFKMGLGTGRGYAGFSWGTTAEPHKWEKSLDMSTEAQVAVDSKGMVWALMDTAGNPALLSYNKELAAKFNAESKCSNCTEADVNVELYPVGTPQTEGDKTGTQYSPGYKISSKRGGNSYNLAINEKDEVFVGWNPAPMGVAWGFEVVKWAPEKNGFVPLGTFTGDEEGKPNGGYSDGKAEYLTMVVVSGDEVVVAYKEDANQKSERQWKASAMAYDGKGWKQLDKQGFTEGTINRPTLAKSSKGDVYLAYDLAVGGSIRGPYEATVVKLDKAANKWVPVGSASGQGSSIEDTHMVIGPDDTMYVGYRETKSGKITVKKVKL